MKRAPTRHFWWGATLLIVLKLFLMLLLPVIGDEAYYFYWAMHPAGGYYDLPPMVAWWLVPFVSLSLSPLWLRLPNLLVMLLIGFGSFELLANFLPKRRALAIASLFLFLPFPYFSLFMFPDVPLLFFSFFSVLLFLRAVRFAAPGEASRPSPALSFLFSGSLWGAAFLSKYFAILLLPAFALFLLRSAPKAWRGILLFAVGAAPFLFQHGLWNATHCWSNFVFNLITRQKANDGSALQTSSYYALYLIILSTPFLWGSFRNRLQVNVHSAWTEIDREVHTHFFFFTLWFIPAFSFGISALMGKGQGIHWLLFVLPFFTVWAGLKLKERELRKVLISLMSFTGGLALFASFALAKPDWLIGRFFEHRLQFEYALATRPKELIEQIKPDLVGKAIVFTEGYTLSSILNYELSREARVEKVNWPEVSVWGSGSRFGRAFDYTTPFKALNHRDVLIITPGHFPLEWKSYFASLVEEERNFAGQKFWVSTGRDFHADDYLRLEFKKPVETYYPPFLPGKCELRSWVGFDGPQ